MFNPSFNLEDILNQCGPYIQEHIEEYLRLVFQNMISLDSKEYIHTKDLGKKEGSEKAAVNRRFLELPDNVKKVLTHCPRKCKGKCRIVERYVGLLCYLHNIAHNYGDNEEVESFSDKNEASDNEETNEYDEEEEEHHDEGEDLNFQEEEKLANQLDIESIKYSTIIKEKDFDLDGEISDLALPCLPSFTINNYEYLLLYDIQCMFNLREDMALALLAQKWEDEKDWVDNDCVFGGLDFCYEHHKGVNLVFNEAKEYEKSLPTGETFEKVQEIIPMPILGKDEASSLNKEKVCIYNQGMEDTQGGFKLHQPTKEAKSIDLWSDKYLEADENFMVMFEPL